MFEAILEEFQQTQSIAAKNILLREERFMEFVKIDEGKLPGWEWMCEGNLKFPVWKRREDEMKLGRLLFELAAMPEIEVEQRPSPYRQEVMLFRIKVLGEWLEPLIVAVPGKGLLGGDEENWFGTNGRSGEIRRAYQLLQCKRGKFDKGFSHCIPSVPKGIKGECIIKYEPMQAEDWEKFLDIFSPAALPVLQRGYVRRFCPSPATTEKKTLGYERVFSYPDEEIIPDWVYQRIRETHRIEVDIPNRVPKPKKKQQ